MNKRSQQILETFRRSEMGKVVAAMGELEARYAKRTGLYGGQRRDLTEYHQQIKNRTQVLEQAKGDTGRKQLRLPLEGSMKGSSI